MECSPPGSSVHGIPQARILAWVVISFSGDLPDPGNPCLLHWRVDSLLLSHQGSLKPGLHGPFSRTGFLPLYPGDREIYFLEKDIPFNILLLLVSAPGQPPFTDNFHPIVRVVHLPPNTTSLIKPTDQGVIAIFKKYYLHHTFHQPVKVSDKSGRTLLQFWKDYNIYKAIKTIAFA